MQWHIGDIYISLAVKHFGVFGANCQNGGVCG